MDIGTPRHHGLDPIGREFAVDTRCGHQLGAVRKKFRATAFVGFDMRQFVADDRVVRLT
jgi:hypothetical protein